MTQRTEDEMWAELKAQYDKRVAPTGAPLILVGIANRYDVRRRFALYEVQKRTAKRVYVRRIAGDYIEEGNLSSGRYVPADSIVKENATLEDLHAVELAGQAYDAERRAALGKLTEYRRLIDEQIGTARDVFDAEVTRLIG